MADIKIKPLGDRVLIEAVEAVEETMGGILIPDSAKEKPQEARVVALGTGKVDEDGKKIEFEVLNMWCAQDAHPTIEIKY
jgi:chaperonin GroES